jgi:hypothetical protein
MAILRFFAIFRFFAKTRKTPHKYQKMINTKKKNSHPIKTAPKFIINMLKWVKYANREQ